MRLPVRAGKTPPNESAGSAKPAVRRLLLPSESRLLLFFGCAVALGLAFPYPVTKHILMGIMGLVVGLVFFTDLRLALCLLPILIPLQTLVPKEFIPIPGINLETILMLMVLIAWRLQRPTFGVTQPVKPMPRFVWVFVAFLLWVTLAAIRTALEGRVPLGDLFAIYKNQWIYVVLIFVVADSLRDERDRVRMMVAVCLSVILVSIQPIYRGTETIALGKSLVRHRAVSLMAMQPNIYGGALACFISFPLSYLARSIGGKKGQLLFATAAGVAAYALVLTMSRGSWLAFGAAVAVIGVLFERKILYILAIGALTSPYWIPEDAVNRGTTLQQMDVDSENFDEEESSGYVRVDQWRAIPGMLADSPIVGHGYMSFPVEYRKFGTRGRRQAAHVGYAEYAAEVGVPGLALYVGTFVALGAFGLVLARRGATVFSRAHGVGILGAAVAMMVAECFGSRFKLGNVTAFLWIYAGVGIAAWRWPSRESTVDPPEVSSDAGRGSARRAPRGRIAVRSRSGYAG